MAVALPLKLPFLASGFTGLEAGVVVSFEGGAPLELAVGLGAVPS